MRVGVLGGTGNVGRSVVRHLLAHSAVREVVLLNRRHANAEELPTDEDRIQECVVDMSKGSQVDAPFEAALTGIDVLVSAIGIGSGKADLETFRWVEVELAGAFARAGKRAGARRGVLLTSVGADIDRKRSRLLSRIADGHYFHLKGLVEKRFTDIGFEDGLYIFRPAGLLGTNHVPKLFDTLLPMVDWLAPSRWRSIHVERLGDAMAGVAVDPSRLQINKGVTVLQGEALFSLVQSRRWQSP